MTGINLLSFVDEHNKVIVLHIKDAVSLKIGDV